MADEFGLTLVSLLKSWPPPFPEHPLTSYLTVPLSTLVFMADGYGLGVREAESALLGLFHLEIRRWVTTTITRWP